MEYYIASPQGPLGPYTVEQLKARQLKPDEMVWRAGLAGWVRADELEEIAVVFSNTALPPTFNRAAFDNNNRPSSESEQAQPNTNPTSDIPCPPTYRWLAIIAFLGLVPCAIIALIKSIMVTRMWEEGNVEGAARQSRKVLLWGILGLAIGIPLDILYMTSQNDIFQEILLPLINQ